VGVARLTGILPQRVAAATVDGVCEPRLAPRQEVDRTIGILSDRRRRLAGAAMLKQAVPLAGGRGDRMDWRRVAELTDDYARLDVPCTIVWGGQDNVLPLSMGYKLAEDIPGAKLRIVTQGMHCLPVERPRECAALVEEFLDGRGEVSGFAKVVKLDPVPQAPFLAASKSPLPAYALASALYWGGVPRSIGGTFARWTGLPKPRRLMPLFVIRPVSPCPASEIQR
jgi:hypothetical protein